MKKVLLLSIVLMVGISIFIGCTKQAPEPATTPKSEPTPTPAPTEVIKLKYSDHTPEQAGIAQRIKRAMEMIEEQSDGRVEITCYFGGSLLPMGEAYRGVQTGVADMCFFIPGTNPGLHELSDLIKLPFIGWPSMPAGTVMLEKLWSDFPQFNEEFEGLKPFAMSMTPPFQILTTKKPVKVPADMKGMKFIASGVWVDYFEPIGTVVVPLMASDWYTALDRGLAEGHAIPPTGAHIFGTLELFKYYTNFGEGGANMGCMMIPMNLNTWNSLPPDIQEIFVDVFDWLVKETLKADIEEVNAADAAAKKLGITVHHVTPEEMKLWSDAAKQTHEDWIAKNEAKGLPAKEIYEAAKQLIKEYAK
jgi:TRAP-type C4-dicarboxylate transport system substrate-binding protein